MENPSIHETHVAKTLLKRTELIQRLEWRRNSLQRPVEDVISLLLFVAIFVVVPDLLQRLVFGLALAFAFYHIRLSRKESDEILELLKL